MRETMKARKAITREMFEPKLGLFLEVTVSPVLGEKGEVTELIHVVKNITERKRMEIDLAQARKLESVGQLAAGIAHEINTPTQFIGDNTRFLKESFGSVLGLVGRYRECQARASQSGTLNPAILADLEEVAVAADLDYLTGEIPKAIDQSLEGIERVSRIVRAMKDFSHPDETEKAETDINRALETTSIVSRNEWKYVAELETEFEANLPPAPCYAGQINQVFLNLIVNAAQAIAARVGSSGEKGVIRISTRRVEGGVEIRVSDTGTGIPEAVRPRMFEPFFTTKEVGKGTGQGLAMSRQIVVKGHGGTITFETETGKGTTFVVWLPGAAENAERGSRNAEGRSQEEQNQGLPGGK
jgi:signal transduction histidine kinase